MNFYTILLTVYIIVISFCKTCVASSCYDKNISHQIETKKKCFFRNKKQHIYKAIRSLKETYLNNTNKDILLDILSQIEKESQIKSAPIIAS